ncbi:MAG: tetratricopeptide repeat protein [Candidatus Kariarchaeaceae archaeon]
MKLEDIKQQYHCGHLDDSLNLISQTLKNTTEFSREYFELLLLRAEILKIKEHFFASLNELDKIVTIPEISSFEIIVLKLLILKSEILNHLSEINDSFELFEEVELRFNKIVKSSDDDHKLLEVRYWRVKGLFLQFHGKHNEAEVAYTMSSNLAEQLENPFELSLSLNSSGLFRLNTGKINSSKQLFEKSHQIGEELQNEYLLVKSYTSLGNFYQVKGDLDLGFQNFEQAMKISEKLNLQDSMVTLYNSYGLIEGSRGDSNKALEYHEKGLQINEKLGIKANISIAYNNIGLIYLVQGELDKALKYQLQSLQIGKGVFEETRYVGSYNNIGIIYSQKGELDKALHNHYKHLQTAEKYNIKTAIATAYVNIGLIHQIKSEYEIAHDYFIKCLAIDREIGNEIDLSESLYNLLILELERLNLDEAKLYLDELVEIDNHVENKIINLRSRLGQAIFNKHSIRFVTRAKAQEMLSQISEEEVIEHELTIYAKMNLCEMLLNELKITGNSEVLEEINELVENLHQIADDQVSYKLKAENYLLQAALELIESNFTGALNLLQEADSISREKGLTGLSKKISEQFDIILARKDSIESLIDKEAPMRERLEKSGVEDLIVKLIKPDDLNVQPEQPAYFLILTQGGVTIYSKSFLDSDIKEELIGGLLTAIYTISEDVFLAGNSVQRIKHDDYTVIIKPAGELLFSYVFTGSSYNALEKLERLIEILSGSQLIWTALIRDLPRISISERNGLDIIVSDTIASQN